MTKYFYDIHCHAMNMSHPNFLAFVSRFEDSFFTEADKFLKNNRIKTFLGANFLLFQFMFFKKFSYDNIIEMLNKAGIGQFPERAKNLIASMENDTGSFFLTMEECIADHVMKDDKIVIGSKCYDKIIITPLIMDFGCNRSFYRNVHYNQKPVRKPVVEQIIDLFNGITGYLEQSTRKLFEIYPFMGINTVNYDISSISEMLQKYFGDYQGKHNTLRSGMVPFDGDVDSLEGNRYAGVKLYPPLGFDPWPEDNTELEKVMLLYDFCQKKQIPVTCHTSDEGFCILSQERMSELTCPSKWEKVLSHYPLLKVNLAHFGKQEKSTQWQKEIIKLIKAYDNVYTDISHRGFDDGFYKDLKNMINGIKDNAVRKKIKERILFGSDFMINLLKIDSYCKYYDVFLSSKHFGEEDKDLFCSENPRSFLFGSGDTPLQNAL